jgi:hypothetical protein
MFEFDDIFANPLTTAVLIYATASMLLISLGLALALTGQIGKRHAIEGRRRTRTT